MNYTTAYITNHNANLKGKKALVSIKRKKNYDNAAVYLYDEDRKTG